jgi:hypothetical protein
MSKAILFLYEGETEKEFFPKLFKAKLPSRNILFKMACLHGNFNINFKVANAIESILAQNKISKLYVFVALDRDGKKPKIPPINEKLIISKVGNDVTEIELIVATQVFESWLFIEIENIYIYLKTPKSQRNTDKYRIYENFTHQHLAQLFKSVGKEYQKGRRVEGLMNAVNIENIYKKCQDLKEQIDKMTQICNEN